MNTNTRRQSNANRNQNTASRNQPSPTTRQQPMPKNDKTERDDEKFWAEWWREYAQTWK